MARLKWLARSKRAPEILSARLFHPVIVGWLGLGHGIEAGSRTGDGRPFEVDAEQRAERLGCDSTVSEWY